MDKMYIWIQWNITQLKNNVVLIHATTWANLENIVLRERSQT